MQKFVIEGIKRPLSGEVLISGSKNASLPIMTATLLARGENILHNVPKLGDVRTMIKLLESVSAKVKWQNNNTLIIDTTVVDKDYVPYDLVSTMRASFLMAGALLGRLGSVCIAKPGGCAIGIRSIDEHLKGFKQLGIDIKEEHGYVKASGKCLKGKDIYMNERSVTTTENLILASATAGGKITIINGAMEPHVMDLVNFLNSAGARIQVANDTIEIEGVSDLHSVEYTVTSDYIEAGTFMAISAITRSNLFLRKAKWDDLISVIQKFKEIGIDVIKDSDGLKIKANSYKSCDIKTAPFPGFPTDLQPIITALLTLGKGTSVVTEMMYEQRFNYVPELNRMEADIKIDERNAIISGVPLLSGAKVMASDIRGGAALVVAGLAANGITEIARIYHIDRGYDKIEFKLQSLGANIKRV